MKQAIKKIYLFLIIGCLFSKALPQECRDKWYIITTINKPTEVFKKLSKLEGWHGLVVADKKTPKDWSYPNVTLLSVEDQQKSKYKIAQILPWNHYSRKNIGFLYAIEHGAEIIYETDDDNFLIEDNLIYCPEYSTCMMLETDASVYNIYALFGQPKVWPRGYPLKSIASRSHAAVRSETNIFMPIQQGLVNKDPDVDAIFRLTRNELLDFNDKGIIAYPAGIFCPFNCQNTFIYKSAFWGLLLPITVTSRVADIWRSYWVQRLLWDIDASVCFLAPNAYQDRNEHDYLKDFIEELDLYLYADALVEILKKWKSNKADLFERMIDLFTVLVDAHYIKEQDLILLKAWIEDLQAIGYQAPKPTK